MTILQGDRGGIVFRVNNTNSTFYDFLLGQDGSYTLTRYTSVSTLQVLKNGDPATPVSAIHTGTGQTNLIAVVAISNTLTLYVNHQQIATVNDSTYSQGQLGFAVENDGHPTEVAFQNARVWTF